MSRSVWPAFSNVLLLSALISASPALAAPAVVDQLKASVNSSLILLSDVSKFKETVKLRSQLDPLFSSTSLAAKGPSATIQEVVEYLIDDALIVQQFPVPDAEVEQQINQIQTSNRLDRTALKRALAEQGFSFDQYYELIRISASKRNLIDRDIATKVRISDDDVKNYFYNHYTKSTAVPRAYQMKIITVPVRNYKTTAAAKEVAMRALKEIQSGEPFEEVAKRLSGDLSSSAGGDLGVMTEDQMSPAIREQVKKLQIGGISEIFGSAESGGFYILKLLDVKSGDTDRFEKMKDEIRNQLYLAESQHQISLWLERQRQRAFIRKAGESSIAGLNPPAP